MRNFFIFLGGFLLFIGIISKIGGTEKFPKVYYYTSDMGRTTYVLNEDKTAKIKTELGGTTYTFDTSWSYNGSYMWIKDNTGRHDIIIDDYFYDSIDDAKAKRNGIKLTKNE